MNKYFLESKKMCARGPNNTIFWANYNLCKAFIQQISFDKISFSKISFPNQR